jgi:hypothetical protein
MAQLTPAPKFSATYVDGSGNTKPAVGYKLYAYTAGTTTPKDTYTDYTLGTANANPVILDARGEASIWLSGNYKLVLKDPADSTIWTVDDVRDMAANQTITNMTLAGTLTVTSTAVTWSGNPTHSGNHTFSGNVVINGNTTLGDNAVDALTVLPSAVTWTNNPTHSGTHTWSGAQTYSANPSGRVEGGTYTPTLTGVLNVAASTTAVCQYLRAGPTVTVSGAIQIDPTATATLTEIAISLPVASAMDTNEIQCCGVSCSNPSGAAGQSGVIIGDASADRARLIFWCTDLANVTHAFHFSYRVI